MRNAAVAGTNDLLFCWSGVTFETHLEALARALLQLPEAPRVMLVLPPPLARDSFIGSDRVLRLEMKHRVATMVKRLQLDTPARPFSRVLSVDLRPRFEMYCARGSANRTGSFEACYNYDQAYSGFLADGVHTNSYGSQVIARTIYDALRKQWLVDRAEAGLWLEQTR